MSQSSSDVNVNGNVNGIGNGNGTRRNVKVVLVTGCSKGGIGFHLCEEFARRSCIVYATSRNVDTMADLSHPNIYKLALEVTSDESVTKAVEAVIAKEGRIDMLVNNAGVLCIGPVADIPVELVKKTFDANVFGALRTARAVIPHMAAQKSGTIVNIGSVVGIVPTPWNGIYCASKAALHSLTEVLQMECQPLNISVTLIAPGSVKSMISDNQSRSFSLPQDSLWTRFLPQIVRRMHLSQVSNSMPTNEFAKCVVEKVLPVSRWATPPRYMILGGKSFQVRILEWLPRGLALWLVWRAFTR